MTASALGYDRTLLPRLSARDQRRMRFLGWTMLAPLLCFALSAGYAIWLVEHSLSLALVFAVLGTLLGGNLVRLFVAGGAMPDGSARSWRPATSPVFLLGATVALLGQPLVTLGMEHDIRDGIDAHRQNLIATHAAAPPTAHSVTVPHEEYRREIAKASFLSQRLTLSWRTPWLPGALTLGLVLFAVLPLLLARTLLLPTVRRYEQLRAESQAVVAENDTRRTDATVHQMLACWPSHSSRSRG